MLKKLSEILYLFLISLFILSVIIILVNSTIVVDYKIIYLIILLLFPLFDILIEQVKKDFKIGNLYFQEGYNTYKYIGIIVFVIISYIYGMDLAYFGMLLFLSFGFLFSLDSRVAFIGALTLLLFTPVYLLIGDKFFAEKLSMFGYYLLIIGVVLEIKNTLFPSKNLGKNQENILGGKKENETSFMKYINNLLLEYLQIGKESISEMKKNILTEIGEDYKVTPEKKSNQEKIPFFVKAEKIASLAKEKQKSVSQNLYVKLSIYFLKKLKDNIITINFFFFSLSTILAILLLKYNTENELKFALVLLFFGYIFSKIIGKKYYFQIQNSHSINTPKRLKFISKDFTLSDAILQPNSISQEEINNISIARRNTKDTGELKKNKFFMNKAILYSSLGLIIGYLLLQYYQISTISSSVYLGIFALFFLSYYLVFSDLDSTLFHTSKNTSHQIKKKVGNFSWKNFAKKHVYLILNTTLIFTILIALGIKGGVFIDMNKWYQEKNGYKNWILVKEKIKELTRTEKNQKALEIQKQLSLISGEAQIKINTGETINGSKTTLQQISAKDYHTFTQTLALGANNDEVIKLEEIMKKLNYFKSDPDNIFEENTKEALTNLLKTECNWPETTKGILGNQAMQCLYSLEIEVEQKLEETPITNISQQISVKDYHTFKQTLALGANNNEVLKLEEIMKKLNYFESEPDNTFEEDTKEALTNLLKTECDWPETTKGILGNQAMQCLYSLEIEVQQKPEEAATNNN